jgi:archaeal flagellar protein FlaJ
MGRLSRAKKEAKAPDAAQPEPRTAEASPFTTTPSAPSRAERKALKAEAKAAAKAAKAGERPAKAGRGAHASTTPAVSTPKRAMPMLGAPLAALALLAALGVVGLVLRAPELSMVALPFVAALLALSAALPARRQPGVEPESAKLRLIGLAMAGVAMLLVLATVEGLALFAATGLLFSFTDMAALFVAAYPLLLAGFLAIGALARIGAGLWGSALEVPRRGRALAGVLMLVALAVGGLLALVALGRAPADLEVSVERAPFVAAVAGLAALGAVWAACLPSFPQMGDWLSRAGMRQQRLGKQLLHGFGALAIAASLAGVALWVLVDAALGVPVLALGVLLATASGFPAGVARFKPALGLDDAELVLRRFREQLPLLVVGSLASFFLAIVGVVAGLLAGESESELLPLVAPAAVAGSVMVQALLALASPLRPVPGALSEPRRAVAWDLSLAALLLTVFALLLGSGLAQGPGVGPDLGVLLLLGASMASGGHMLLRVVLPPPRREARPAKPKKSKEKVKAEATGKEQIQCTMHLAYAAGLVFMLLMTGLIATTSLGVVDLEESVGLPSVALVVLGAMLGAPVVGYLGWRYARVRSIEVTLQKQATQQYKRRLTPQEVSRLAIIGGSITTAVLFSVLGLLTQMGVLEALGPFELKPKFSTDFFVFAILVGLGPYGFMLGREQSRTRAIDAKFPEFLRDLAESKRAGMTLTQAVVTASKGSYGALTEDIRKMAAQIEWGVSFSESLERFARRVRTPLIERSVSLIVQASEAGGNVVDILHAAAEDAREIQLLLKERKAAMSIYVMIIYISFFVFLSVIAILDAQFLPEVAKAVGGAKGVSVGPIKFGTIDTDAFEQVFFHAAIIQALGGGFVAGVMEEGRPVAGLRHVFIMVIFGYIAFRFVIG